jgi:hypothetical protein
MAHDTSTVTSNLVAQIDKTFCSDPGLYDWKYIDKREMVVPYNCAVVPAYFQNDLVSSALSHASTTRWEKHRVLIVDAIIRPGESNLLARRRFYIDEDFWCILLGEAYNNQDTMVACYMLTDGNIPTTSKHGKWYPV